MGGPSQFESFTDKPAMDRHAGKTVTGRAGNAGNNPILPSVWSSGSPAVRGWTCARSFRTRYRRRRPVRHRVDGLRRQQPSRGATPRSMTGDKLRESRCRASARGSPTGWAGNKDLPGFVYLAEGNHHASGFPPAETQGMPLSNRMPNPRRPQGVTAEQHAGSSTCCVSSTRSTPGSVKAGTT